jgi:L-alanine-DL-glutamate epimerase-like enolase superfamily enzyme
MMSANRADAFTISIIEFWPMDLPMTDPFMVATGTRLTAQNVFVRVTLAGGDQGYGEAAPLPEVEGETRDDCLLALNHLSATLIGQSANRYRHIAQRMAEASGSSQQAARCALETAVLDAFCHAAGVPMWALWGGADVRTRETDITIPIASIDRTLQLAYTWHAHGFRLFKMKVGKKVDEDIARLEALHRALPGIGFIGDGNQGFTREEALTFVNGVRRFGGKLILFEQPVARHDLDGLAAIRHLTGIPVAADESVRSLADAQHVIDRQAADYINIKIMKTGVIEAIDIAAVTRSSGLRLMIGGMLETRLAMGCSLSMVLGMGGIDVLDLDTPLLMSADPIHGGYRYDGPRLLPWNAPGLDVWIEPAGIVTVIE